MHTIMYIYIFCIAYVLSLTLLKEGFICILMHTQTHIIDVQTEQTVLTNSNNSNNNEFNNKNYSNNNKFVNNK